MIIYTANLFGQFNKSLSEQWEISDTITRSKQLLNIVPYKPFYLLFTNYTTDVNRQPFSENLKNSVQKPLDYDKNELKFQFSIKTKVINNVLGKKLRGSIWLGYTQTSRWQLYNGRLSRPFRETNYEPEVMLIVPTRYKILGIKGVFVGIGINHQSNGLSYPLSRSWNRLIYQIGWEVKDLSIVFRPWRRIREEREIDDNPGIEDYIGRGELLINYQRNRHQLNLALKSSFIFSGELHGGLQTDYSFRIYENLKIRFQMYYGYGESLIDYNHRQTTFGFGVSI
jgi:phospholipase A1